MSSAIPFSKYLTPEVANTAVSGASLKGKSVLITGGASGLGAGCGTLYAEKGAYVTLVDLQEDLGKPLAAELQKKGFHVQFVKTDVTNWASLIAAFKAAIAFSPTKDTVDIVLAAAGVFGPPILSKDEPAPSLEVDPEAPNPIAIQVNTIGMLYTAKLAQVYFKLPSSAATQPKSLTIVSSLAAYFDIPAMAGYSASKHGARGLFRTFRPIFADRGLRINLLAPWILETPMTTEWLKMFTAAGAPWGNKDDFFKIALRLADDSSVNGRAFAIGPKRVLDLGDDLEGEFAGKAMADFYKVELPGWDAMAARMEKMMGL